MTPETPDQQIDLLLDGTADELDIPPAVEGKARERYQDVGSWLSETSDRAGGSAWHVYPQGSIPLGTVVQPKVDGTDYDVDLVCERDIKPESTTTAGLKMDTGDQLEAYAQARRGTQVSPDSIHQGRRCWTLEYPALRLHLDALPAIPDPEDGGTGILLADRDLRPWQRSNPLAFIRWFTAQGQRQLALKEARGQLDPMPAWSRRTVLQRDTQVIKRHRDLFYGEDLVARPPSVLVTTLVAHSYGGQTSIVSAVAAASARMTDFILNRQGTLWVANPTQPQENFADRWQADPRRRERFDAWMAALRQDIEEIRTLRGTAVMYKMSEVFGREPVYKSAESLGERTRALRENGLLMAAAGTAMLGTGTGTKVRNHAFYATRPRP